MADPPKKGLGAALRDLRKLGHPTTAILGAAIIENRLRRLLLTKMRPISGTLEARIFDGYGPFGSFSARIDLAFALNLLTDEMFATLKIAKDIRNEFAHPKALEFLHYDSPEVCRHLERLPGFKENKRSLDDFYLTVLRDLDNEIVEMNPSAATPESAASS